MYSSTLSLTSALYGGWMVYATPRPLYSQVKPGNHCIGGWVSPRTSLEGCGKFHPHQDSILGLSSPKRVASHINHNSFINKGLDSAQQGFIKAIQIFENLSVVRRVLRHSLSHAHVHTYSHGMHNFITLTSC